MVFTPLLGLCHLVYSGSHGRSTNAIQRGAALDHSLCLYSYAETSVQTSFPSAWLAIAKARRFPSHVNYQAAARTDALPAYCHRSER